jgi:pimeloyl-ACP methyl ester carboxylesterase
MRSFFIPGGPGLNGEMERRELAPILSESGLELITWDEPSSLRGASPNELDFRGWLESASRRFREASQAHGPLVLIAHSFGAQAALRIAAAEPASVRQLILLAPALEVAPAFRGILRIALADLEAASSPSSARLAELAGTLGDLSASKWPAWKEAFEIALTDPALLAHYWKNPGSFQASIRHLADPRYGFDVPSFFGVLASFSRVPGLQGAVSVPATLVFADDDPIAVEAEQAPAAGALLRQMTILRVPGASHFVHLDSAHEFAPALVELAGLRSAQRLRPVTTNLL